MAGFTNAMPTSFKVEVLRALHNFSNPGGNTFKVALGKASTLLSGTYGADTTNYSDLTGNSDEVANGNGYTTGGNTLTSVTPFSDGTTSIADFADTTWSGATFVTSGAIIYNTSSSNRACAVINFGGDQEVVAGDFTIQFPPALAATAIIRIL